MASSNFFGTLKPFTDGNGAQLNTFLSKFNRCCVVTNKVDGATPVKGQLLMMHVGGRAQAALDEFELTQGEPQTYDALVAKLKEFFDSNAARESSSNLFDARTKKLTETEEEFMLDLLQLYQTANPNHDNAVTTLSVKRKFLSGISPVLREKIFVFCNDPYAAAVSRENLLSHCRKAQNLLRANTAQPSAMDSSRVLTTSDQPSSSGYSEPTDQLVAALNNINSRFDEYDSRFDYLEDTIASISNNQYRGNNNSYRGRGRGGRRGNFNGNRGGNNFNGGGNNFNGGGNNFNGNRGGNNNSGRGGNHNNNNRGSSRGGSRGGGRGRLNGVRCYNCNGYNHIAQNCTFTGN